MSLAVRNYATNLLRLLRRRPANLLRPLMVTYYVTARCNLNCVYCEDFGARRNSQAEKELSLKDAQRVLRILRQATDRITFTGGEPLLYADIIPLAAFARHELDFRHITLLTNGLLLLQFRDILPAIDRLVISLDATDPEQWQHTIQAPATTSQTILENIQIFARLQRTMGYRVILNCVLSPETLIGAEQVLKFAVANDLLVSFSPQAVHNWPRYELLVSQEYRRFLSRLIDLKRRGAPVLGSTAYLRHLHEMSPFGCHPTLVPRVMPNGDLAYPCRPIEQERGSHGGRPCNLLKVDSWEQALKISLDAYGAPPYICTSCFQQCYAEASLMQARPLSLLWEVLRHAPARSGAVWTYAPG